jgi:hypothetical protein
MRIDVYDDSHRHPQIAGEGIVTGKEHVTRSREIIQDDGDRPPVALPSNR